MTKILFICHGNICRSPMAECIFKDMVSKAGCAAEFFVASAATSTEEIWGDRGNPVYPPARKILAEHGIDCDGKYAVQVTKDDYNQYDYLICMDSRNITNTTRITGADTEGKISLLLDFAGRQGQSIADPWYTRNFQDTYDDIIEGCSALLEYLCNSNYNN